MVLSAALLAASHVVSYFTNFLGRGEYLRVTPQGQMLSVYGRVVVLHVTIVAGAGLVGAFGTPSAFMGGLWGVAFGSVGEDRGASTKGGAAAT